MHVAVLLFYCNDNPRVTEFTQPWAEKAVSITGDYLRAQSAGRVNMTWQVFDWVELQMTANEWIALSSQGIDAVLPVVGPQMPGVSLGGFDHYLVAIDVPGAGGGTTPGNYTFLAAQNFDPSYIGHELGHVFGAGDAWGETSAGTMRYQNSFCVMGSSGWPATFASDFLTDEHAAGHTGTGPGMSAPTLLATGWLDPSQHGMILDLTGADLFQAGGRTEAISALIGSPPPGQAWTRAPLVLRYDDLLIEYRARRAWDGGLPDPGPDAHGWLVAHRSPADGPVATHVASAGATPGATLVLGQDNPLDIGHAGPLTVTVMIENPADETVRVSLSRRPPHAGSSVGLIWTPSGGWVHVPEHSGLLRLLETVGSLSAIHAVSAQATAEELDVLRTQSGRLLQELKENVAQLPVDAPRTPLEEAVDQLDALTEQVRSLTDPQRTSGSREELLDTQRALERARDLVREAQAETRG